ncbi:probable WRKY transcription factor 50 isoform X1 [Ipomoea triloba]|uniref:probable WRKY transcription factor 50 isoform X1 n=1 Tax=Ipomoea triloba TaxID=35885 RepID=UPI00125DC3FA|nr:probable WRKY transcription factor 50 isoform X1 [Ipomoea triloba]
MSDMNPNFLGPNMMSTPPSYTNPNSNNLHFYPEMLQDYDYDYAQDFELSYVNTLLNDDYHHHYSNVVNNPFASSSSLFSHPQPTPTNVQDKSSTTSASSGSSGFDGMMPTTYPMQEVRNSMRQMVNTTKAKERHSIAFRTKTELEILDDGYKWRKYGKKKVKSNSNPRNYYKCSHEGCVVKKRVERDGEDSKFLITEYEGIHNHESPYVIYYY